MQSVLHVVSSLKLGGAERFALELSQLQRQNGYDVTLLSLGDDDDFLITAAEDSSIPLMVSNSRHGRLKRYRDVSKLLRKSDVVHFHNTFGLRFMMPLLLLYPAKKYIYTRHGIYRFNSIRWKFFHQFIRMFIDYVTFVTQSGMDVYKSEHRWNPARLRVIENGVYIPPMKARELHAPIRFGSVGRMVELKGQHFLLESIARLLRQQADSTPKIEFELHFYGSGPVEASLREHAAQIDSGCKIVFHGVELDREKIYASIDVLIVSSRSEGMSLVIMEAMARGIPTIATDVGGNTTLVKDGHTGLIVEYGDETELAAAICKCLRGPQLIFEYGDQARQMVGETYSLAKTLQAYCELYEG